MFLKQSVEGAAWFRFTACNKMWEERKELKKNLLSKKVPEFKDLENVKFIQTAIKMRKLALKRIPRVCFTSQLIRILVWVWTMDLIRVSTRSQEERWDYTSKTMLAGTKENRKWKGMKAGCEHVLSFRKRKQGPQRLLLSAGLLLPTQVQSIETWGSGLSPLSFREPHGRDSVKL